MELFNQPNLIYWFILALTIALETLTVGYVLKYREAARWTIGYATVFMLSLPLVLLGVWDADTYAAIFVAIGISGAVKVGIQQITDANRAESSRRRAAAVKELTPNGQTDWQ